MTEQVKVMAISTQVDPKERLEAARREGYVTFIYHHADPKGDIVHSRFLLVHSDTELKEKIALLNEDRSLVDEVRRLA